METTIILGYIGSKALTNRLRRDCCRGCKADIDLHFRSAQLLVRMRGLNINALEQAEWNTFPETDMETQTGPYDDYSPSKGGYMGFHVSLGECTSSVHVAVLDSSFSPDHLCSSASKTASHLLRNLLHGRYRSFPE